GLRRTSPGDQRSRRRYLAGQLYGVRSRLHRSGGKTSAASRQPFWPKSVTYVSGTICHLCLRAGPLQIWRRGWDSNPRLSFPNTRFPSVLLKPLGHLSVVIAIRLAQSQYALEMLLPRDLNLPGKLDARSKATERCSGI